MTIPSECLPLEVAPPFQGTDESLLSDGEFAREVARILDPHCGERGDKTEGAIATLKRIIIERNQAIINVGILAGRR
jgi:alpha/beta superfamily hydrolase